MITVLSLSACTYGTISNEEEPVAGQVTDRSGLDAPKEIESDNESGAESGARSELTDKERYEANVFLGNFVEQRHNNEGAYSFGADSEIYDLVFFAFKYTDMHLFEDFGMDGAKTMLRKR